MLNLFVLVEAASMPIGGMEANLDAFLNSLLAGVRSLTMFFLSKDFWNVGSPFRSDGGQNNSNVTTNGGPTAGAGRNIWNGTT
jgi:hypothetical protein